MRTAGLALIYAALRAGMFHLLLPLWWAVLVCKNQIQKEGFACPIISPTPSP